VCLWRCCWPQHRTRQGELSIKADAADCKIVDAVCASASEDVACACACQRDDITRSACDAPLAEGLGGRAEGDGVRDRLGGGEFGELVACSLIVSVEIPVAPPIVSLLKDWLLSLEIILAVVASIRQENICGAFVKGYPTARIDV
jgi:hypothetical protein